MADFYRPLDPAICQGDVFDNIPSLLLKPPLLALRRVTLAGGKPAMGYYEYPGAEPTRGGAFHFDRGEETAASGVVARAIVLNHDCDIENDPEYRLVALVRPLAVNSILEDGKKIIRENRNYSYFHLPPTDGLPESYVDFRRITSISPVFLERGRRLFCLSDVAAKAFRYQLIQFFTRPSEAEKAAAPTPPGME